MKIKHNIRVIGILFFLTICQITLGQTNKEKAYEKGMQAVKLEDEGKYDEAIKLLEEAQKLDPEYIEFPYELGYAYYAKKEYKKAAKYLEGILDHPKVYDQVFQLLGNCYDEMGKSEKAIEMYDAGIKKFPISGKLYLEKGNIYWQKEEYVKALPLYEQGIKVDPKFASNYYRAAKIYCATSEEVWGMIYGEIFINLERTSERTSEISKLLYDTYKREIKFTSDTSYSVSFSKNAAININDLKDPGKLKLPFGVGTYEPTLMLSMVSEKSIDINSLDRIRKNFVEMYFKNGNDKTYPNVLFDFQNKILQAGHLEAYNHWVLMRGDGDGFQKWQASNKEKWTAFTKWFSENKLKIDDANKFYSGQY
jgi:tetratricopeptide (TPR) repeat protein